MQPGDRQIRTEILYVLFGVIFIILNLLGINDPVSDSISILFTPLTSVGGEIGKGILSTSETLTSIFDIRSERNDLLIENAELEARLATFLLVQDELDTLRSEVEYDKDLSKQIQSSILSWGYGNIEGNLILNKGSVDGVRTGDIVTVGSIYIGTVIDVTESVSKVLIPTNNKSSLEVVITPYMETIIDADKRGLNRIVSKDRQQLWNAVSRGDNGSILLENIPKNSSVKVGDHVIVSDVDVPDHYYLGDIIKVIVDPTDVQIKAIVAQPLDINNLTSVMINISDE